MFYNTLLKIFSFITFLKVNSDILEKKALAVIAKNIKSLLKTADWKDAVDSDPEFVSKVISHLLV